MSYRDTLVTAIKEHHFEGFRTRAAKITKTQNEIRSYFEHLKADIAEELLISKDVSIKVSYATEGVFVEIQIERYSIKFIRKKYKVEVWGTALYMREEVYLYPYQLDVLNGAEDNINDLIDKYLKEVFSGECLLGGMLDLTFEKNNQ
jgi:hypothetical protein